MRDNYILRVQVGNVSDKSQWETITVNEEKDGHYLENDYFQGYIKVRIVDYDGLPVNSETKETLYPQSDYFLDSKSKFSVEFKGKFKPRKGGWNANKILFGNQFEKQLKLPPLVDIATKFATWYDPGLKIDLRAEKPWAYSKLLVAFNRLDINIDDDIKLNSMAKVRENTSLISGIKEDDDDKALKKRQRFFSDENNASRINIDENLTLHGDFYNAYLDFSKRGLAIPFFTLNVMDYWDGHDLSYYCKYDGDEDIVFFVVSFQLAEINTI
ncbi:hypothetical protein K502DRAFT_326392 [Neoconidiobolus thromboides FSU 785]|nr:hypothetical protein K502DRAFT_326392 [Neoconidiobolus thromboides FSU 785]